MRKKRSATTLTADSATHFWGKLSPDQLSALEMLVNTYGFSVVLGDIQRVESNWYVTHTGLLRLAARERCCGIHVRPAIEFCDPSGSRWAFKAVVYKSRSCKGFVGFGDASPSNVSPLVYGAEMRIAETRAVNRALRKAYGVGICSVDELGTNTNPRDAAPSRREPTLRDRLCVIVRQHNLDADLVKRYAAEFCGTATIREASREMIADFIDHLAARARDDRDALVEELARHEPAPAPQPAEEEQQPAREEVA